MSTGEIGLIVLLTLPIVGALVYALGHKHGQKAAIAAVTVGSKLGLGADVPRQKLS